MFVTVAWAAKALVDIESPSVCAPNEKTGQALAAAPLIPVTLRQGTPSMYTSAVAVLMLCIVSVVIKKPVRTTKNEHETEVLGATRTATFSGGGNTLVIGQIATAFAGCPPSKVIEKQDAARKRAFVRKPMIPTSQSCGVEGAPSAG